MVKEAGTSAAPTGRDNLLDAVIQLLLDDGISNKSQRQIAADIATSHRMLRYHFGDLRDMISAAVAEIRRRETEAFDELLERCVKLDTRSALELFWEHNSGPELRKYFRLLFEYWGIALSDREHFQGLLSGIVSTWTDRLTPILERNGAAGDARTSARLAVGALRGLLLDLVTTDDFDEVNAAFRLLIARLE
ncbi:TetR/AcrR family transcriptional regulator (plasmid) [Rhodococcus globerulus]|uniref:TetR/AcrR family transcriptional regulator n=1 Tax=Rhodococcus globerulus TaxID=33008 RepID=UPI0039E9F629